MRNYSCDCDCDWSKLPQDLWVEILCRVPSHNSYLLTKYKTVCKLWIHLIATVCNPKLFASSGNAGSIFKVIKGNYHPSLDFKLDQTSPSVGFLGPVAVSSALLPFTPTVEEFVGYCNGLLLFIHDSCQQYYVCNPTTRQCLAIPVCSQVQNFSFHSLAFDPSRSPHFKLICFDRVRPCIKYYIFSSDTSCRWDVHNISLEHPAISHSWRTQSVYSNSVLFRLSESKHLICFDINQFNAYAIDLPEKETTNISGVTEGRGLIFYSSHDDCNNLKIWMLEGYSKAGSWILIRKISIADMYTSRYYCCSWILTNAPCFESSSDRIYNVILAGTPEMMVLYNVDTQQVHRFWKMEKDKSISFGQYTFWPFRRCYSLIYLTCSNIIDYGSNNLDAGREEMQVEERKRKPLHGKKKKQVDKRKNKPLQGEKNRAGSTFIATHRSMSSSNGIENRTSET